MLVKHLLALEDDPEPEAVWERFDPKSVCDSLHNPRPTTTLRRFAHALVRFGTILRKFQVRYEECLVCYVIDCASIHVKMENCLSGISW
jgi:hypothetical protein